MGYAEMRTPGAHLSGLTFGDSPAGIHADPLARGRLLATPLPYGHPPLPATS